MRVIFVRHGESQDDIDNCYGGWADFPLTDKGKMQIADTVVRLQKWLSSSETKLDKIFTSPLQRAKSTAGILSKGLGVKMQELLWIKERNTYGLLCGVNKDYAKKEYPDLWSDYEEGRYVAGQEREEDVKIRVKTAVEKLQATGLKCVIAVTHGNFMKALMPELVGKTITKKEDGGFIVIDIDKTGKGTVVHMDGIEVG